MNRLMNGRKLRPLIEPCYMTKTERMRENVCNLLAPENESQCQKVAEVSQSVRLELRLDLEPAPVPVTRLPVPLNHYYIYGLASICDNANRRPKKTNLLRATTTCNLKIDAWSQQLQDKALTRAKIMKIETSSIMNSLMQYSTVISKFQRSSWNISFTLA